MCGRVEYSVCYGGVLCVRVVYCVVGRCQTVIDRPKQMRLLSATDLTIMISLMLNVKNAS